MRGALIVAGGGMAGLVAAVRAHELGGRARLYERARPGGSMLLSSGVIWRHADFADFRRECPGGDAALQATIWERLDEALEWLRRLGAPVVHDGTGNALTRGARFDPAGLCDALLARLPAGCLRLEPAPLGTDPDVPTLLATGGFAASRELVARYVRPAAALRLRANRASRGDGLRHGLARGGALSAGMDEFYGRNMPAAPWRARDFVPLAQLYARHARIFDERGVEFFHARDVSWSETNVVQATARRSGARAYYVLGERSLAARSGAASVAELVARVPARARLGADELPFTPPRGARVAVHVAASITHTIGGLALDTRARVLGEGGEPLAGLYAAGVDAGGVATGGYASGLAQALVLGLVGAESALAGV